jgi:hypothetical protein
MTGRIVTRAAAAALVCAMGTAPAGVRDGMYELGAYGGIQAGDNNENVSSDSAFGARFGYALSRKIMIELNLDSFDTTKEIVGRAGRPDLPANQRPYSHEVGTSFLAYSVGLTANFLTDRDVRTTPYLSVSLGAVTEERDAALFCVDLRPNRGVPSTPQNPVCSDLNPDGTPVDPNYNPARDSVDYVSLLKDKDSGALLAFAVGGRTFLSNSFAVRYEGRWYHHNTFRANQDAFELSVGATFVLGGQK